MTSSFTPPPLTPMEHRLQVAGSLEMAYRFGRHLDVDGLKELRVWLRHEDTRGVCANTGLAAFRASLLEAVCRELVARGEVGSVAYFESVGDVLPAVPDDLSAIDV